MHPMLAEELVVKVRQRIKEGDCPTTPPLSVEMLEHLVDHLAADVDRAGRQMTELTDRDREQPLDDLFAAYPLPPRDWLRSALSISVAPLDWRLSIGVSGDDGVAWFDIGPLRFSAFAPWAPEPDAGRKALEPRALSRLDGGGRS